MGKLDGLGTAKSYPPVEYPDLCLFRECAARLRQVDENIRDGTPCQFSSVYGENAQQKWQADRSVIVSAYLEEHLPNGDRKQHAFLRRTRDGKFYRGARFWRWTRTWRLAAVLPVYFWNQYVVHQITGENLEFVFLDDVE